MCQINNLNNENFTILNDIKCGECFILLEDLYKQETPIFIKINNNIVKDKIPIINLITGSKKYANKNDKCFKKEIFINYVRRTKA